MSCIADVAVNVNHTSALAAPWHGAIDWVAAKLELAVNTGILLVAETSKVALAHSSLAGCAQTNVEQNKSVNSKNFLIFS